MPLKKHTWGLLTLFAFLIAFLVLQWYRLPQNEAHSFTTEFEGAINLYIPAPLKREDPLVTAPSYVDTLDDCSEYYDSGAPPKREASLADTQMQVRQQAVVAWDHLIESILDQEELELASASRRVHKDFQKIHPDDQLEPLQQALMMFTDQQFLVMYHILFDPEQNPEVLEAIFDNALNRSEELKIPLMTKLRENPEHPCAFESARILDVISDEKIP
jgi:hypothetical protein